MRKMIGIIGLGMLVSLFCVGYADEPSGMSVPQKAFRLRLDGKSQQAKEMLSGYLKEHPDDMSAQFEYSRVLAYLFDLESAEKHAALAVKLAPDNPRYHCWRGMCATYLYIDQAHHKGNLDPTIVKRAIAEFQQAVELKPDYHHARFLLINLLSNNPPEQGGDRKQAGEHTEYLMETDLDYGLQATVIVNGGKSLDWKIEQYQDALSKEPDNAGLHAGIALLYSDSGQTEKSQEHVNKALQRDEQKKDVLLDIAFQLAMKKQYESAKVSVQRYLDLASDESAAMRAFALFYRAKIEKMSGNPNADEILRKVKQTDPDVWMTMKAPPAMLFQPLG